MKKLPLHLVAIVAVSLCIYFVSCKKETGDDTKELPAVQKIRQAVSKPWEVKEKSLATISLSFSEKISPKFANFGKDSNIVINVWVKFEGEDKEVMLPHVVPGFGGTKYYFYSLEGGKPTLYFHNSGACDLTGTGASSALPMEEVSFNFTKIDF